MNIVQEFYEDFIKPKPKLFKKKRMDDQIQQPQENQEVSQEEVVETPVVEDVVAEQPEDAAPVAAKDPSFNCTPCSGEGLLPNGNLCVSCQGTGKV